MSVKWVLERASQMLGVNLALAFENGKPLVITPTPQKLCVYLYIKEGCEMKISTCLHDTTNCGNGLSVKIINKGGRALADLSLTSDPFETGG